MENKLEKKKYSNKLEILRFVIVGVIATTVDLIIKIIINTAIGDSFNHLNNGDSLKTFIGYTCGFLIGVVVNYLLSTFWVFKNVKDDK